MSKIVPSEVQTGDLKGWRDRAQKLKGRRLKVLSGAFDLDSPEPALAEYASSEAHSLWVIYERLQEQQDQEVRRSAYVEFVRT